MVADPRRSPFTFILEARDAPAARAGVLYTPHGAIRTPVFMPVGTNASVKSLSPDDLWLCDVQIVLANTYHLSLRPGADRIATLGGLHRFMRWSGPILTDSGGFQVFSLGHLRAVSEEGVTFRSHLDGSARRFTPESVQELEAQIGADIVMPLDQPIALPAGYEEARDAMERTTRWLARSIEAHVRADQALFGIVQGATYADLRVAHARALRQFNLPGYAIGGLSVGESKQEMHAMLEALEPELPADRPRYLMGVGAPEDLVEGVARGIDMFDVVLPTRIARNGTLLARTGRVNLKNAANALRDEPIEPGCGCPTCRGYSLAYLHHLYRCEELLVYRLATIHNIWFMTHLIADIRDSIMKGRFAAFRDEFHQRYRSPDPEVARLQRTRRRLSTRDTAEHPDAPNEEGEDG
ncbi:MAG TPA: tRNA guanosine(34) transglycosylase Tgt [Chloroflexota bacterium]|nr:tRNA guanosine(34) transglycosylase Tgt [Chloroflexota bacterium]